MRPAPTRAERKAIASLLRAALCYRWRVLAPTLGAAESADLVIAPDYCPNCGKREFRWCGTDRSAPMTVNRERVFVETYRCDACGHEERVRSTLTVTSTADGLVVAGRSNGGA